MPGRFGSGAWNSPTPSAISKASAAVTGFTMFRQVLRKPLKPFASNKMSATRISPVRGSTLDGPIAP